MFLQIKQTNTDFHQLNQELLDLVLQRLDLRSDRAAVRIGCDAHRHHRARNAACASQSVFRLDKDVRDVLIFAKQRKMQENLQGLGVSSHHNELARTTIQRLGRFVGTTLCANTDCEKGAKKKKKKKKAEKKLKRTELLEIVGLLHEVQDGHGQAIIGKRKSFRIHGFSLKEKEMSNLTIATQSK